MKNTKSKIRGLILIIIFIVTTLLLLRFILEFSQLSQPSIITTILLLPTDFISILFRSITIGSIEVSTIIAIIFFISIGYISSKVITAIERKDEDSTILEIIEAVTRIIEILILFRVILKLIGATTQNSPFTGLVYILTDWTGILLRPLDLTFGFLEVSSLVMLLVIIIIDFNTEIILRAFKFVKAGSAKSVDFLSKKDIKEEAEKIENVETLEETEVGAAQDPAPETTDTLVNQNTDSPTAQTEQPQPTSNSDKNIVIEMSGGEINIDTTNALPNETIHKDDKAVPEG